MQADKKRYILGADPGKHGAIALLNADFNPNRLSATDLILIPVKKTKDGRLDVDHIYTTLLPYVDNIVLVVQERVHALFGSSATGTFEFGDANGALRTTLQLLGYASSSHKPFKVHVVSPPVWQKVAWLPEHLIYEDKMTKIGARRKKDTKATSTKAAQSIFPGVSFVPPRCRIVHDGLVDAALIAYYGFKKLLVNK